MPTWGEELTELAQLVEEFQRRAASGHHPRPGDPSPHDALRRKYLKQLHERTGRAVIVYASAWLENKEAAPNALSINLGDMQGFMEACSNIEKRELDLFLLSPGGAAEAAESIVEYLRTRFDHIRAVVPFAAMSAATMIALSADEIIMGTHSQLGPIDPQFTLPTPEGPRSSPSQAILDQFERAKKECGENPANIAAWMPILRSYLPGLIAQCDHARDLSESYVENWLQRFMFRDESDSQQKARKVAHWFSDFGYFRSHGRRVSRDDARAQGVRVVDLEADHALQDSILSVHHAFQHTLTGTPTIKVIENHHGRAWIQQHMTQTFQIAPQHPATPGGGGPTPPQPPRADRRRQARGARKKKSH